MAQISEALIEEIRSKADIVEVIGAYIPLIKKGRNYTAVCPFHDDHSPSLSISTEKQIYKCFVCGAGGNVFTFVEEYEQINFVQAVIKVAEICHIDVAIDHSISDPHPIKEEFKILYKILNETISFCEYQLKIKDGEHVLNYLHERGLDDDIISTYKLGFNPGGNALYKFLSTKGYHDEDIVRSGVVRLASSGLVDVFDERIMFPIHDQLGNPIAFSARDFQLIKNPDRPKYTNTSQNELYNKGSVIYNYHRAKNIARKMNEVIVVEGPLDVMALHRVNYFNVVATMGTAFTSDQALILKRMCNASIMCYDGDDAGQNANYKAGRILNELQIHCKIIRNSSMLDPDEIIKKFGTNELKSMLEMPLNWIDFLFIYLPKRFNLGNYDDKKEFAKQIMHEINQLDNAFDKSAYIERLSNITGFGGDQLNRLDNISLISANKLSKTGQTSKSNNLTKYELAENTIISQMLHDKRASDLFEEKLGTLLHTKAKYLSLFLITYYREHNEVYLSDLISEIDDIEIRNFLFELEESYLYRKEFNEELLIDSFNIIIQDDIDKQIEDLNTEIISIQDPIAKAKIYSDIILLNSKKKGMTR